MTLLRFAIQWLGGERLRWYMMVSIIFYNAILIIHFAGSITFPVRTCHGEPELQ